jgi:hypothetical protein
VEYFLVSSAHGPELHMNACTGRKLHMFR